MQRQQEYRYATVQNVQSGEYVQEARALVSSSGSTRHLTFHTDHIGMTTADVDQVESVAGYVWFRRRCLKAEV